MGIFEIFFYLFELLSNSSETMTLKSLGNINNRLKSNG